MFSFIKKKKSFDSKMHSFHVYTFLPALATLLKINNSKDICGSQELPCCGCQKKIVDTVKVCKETRRVCSN